MFISKNRFACGLTAFAVVFSICTTPSVYAFENSLVSSVERFDNERQNLPAMIQDTNLDPSLTSRARDFENGLEYIVSIPDEVLLRGDEATNEWLKQNPYPGLRGTTSFYASVWGCTVAILDLTAGNLVGAAKLFTIKKYIASLGGVKEAVQLMWGASFKYEKMQALGGALAALAGEISGVTSVRRECFQ